MGGIAGIVASGHTLTSAAAAEVLAAGGNAFDAALGGLCASCVTEPLLTSLGGGGFLLAQPAGQDPVVFDFFAQTPHQRRHASDIDFFPILANFGTATQEFHIGLGSMAVPGTIAGLFFVHRALGQVPMETVMGPAIDLARGGVPVSRFQASVGHILTSILDTTPEAMQLVATREQPERIAAAGDIVRHPEMADMFEALMKHGPIIFYQGELAHQLTEDCRKQGGQLTLEDLQAYRVITRQPVTLQRQGAEFIFNAPPSPGGTLLAFALGMLDQVDLEHQAWGSQLHVKAIVSAINAASRMRRSERLEQRLTMDRANTLLAPDSLEHWRAEAMPNELFSRGTTQLSVVDEFGNTASMTTSNGEGCAYVLPGTGVMMNNMLGEQDLNPEGFHRWPQNRRLASMMCPTIASLADGSRVALGSGGANRIRSAVLQVLTNLFGLGMPLDRAVMAPRMHLEDGHLSLENGFPEPAEAMLLKEWPDHRVWPEPNMFFGGVHAAERLVSGEFRGMGDPRRGGAVAENS